MLRAACEEAYPRKEFKDGLPHLTVVVVGKRHHTRFYPKTEEHADSTGNTRPGTVVDRGVTEARSWDFFLQAHKALQGTARPGHYFVVLDEIFRGGFHLGVDLPRSTDLAVTRQHKERDRKSAVSKANVADDLQVLTQKLCYVFGRSTSAVGYCTPAYYADILCERARCYLSKVLDPQTKEDADKAGSRAAAATSEAEREAAREEHLQRLRNEIRVHDKLKDTMFYI